MTDGIQICTLNLCAWPTGLCQRLGVPHYKEERLVQVIEFIAKEQFDIVFIQEVYQDSHYKTLKTGLEPLGYHFYIGKYTDTVPTLWYKFNLSGLCIISKERLIAREQYWFKSQGSLDAMLGVHRSSLWAVMANSKIVLCNTHCTPSYSVLFGWWESFEDILKSQLQELYELLQKQLEAPIKPRHWIVGGDFNIDHRSNLFQQHNPLLKLKCCQYTDANEPSCNPAVEFARIWDKDIQCVDHIFTNLLITKQHKPQLNLSDHFPFVCTLATKDKNHKSIASNTHKMSETTRKTAKTRSITENTTIETTEHCTI